MAEVNVGKKTLDLLIAGGYSIQPVYKCLQQDSPYGNTNLEAFFQSGQFEVRDRVVPLKQLPRTTQANVTTSQTIKSTAASTKAANSHTSALKSQSILFLLFSLFFFL
ncbi:hypothetical protein BCR33DRAFT_721838 [Rhizoclosmatium globosum]|uniref:Uncharacterized protein n=1 Tax=Rhizoclosmatium globosum TaxID=329046 RepID=A0A1Y2BQ95_9FUNG|nr:hypothetical protein BCR33DRAFT_721838 [Rhizoclosmatium globosum]|eukprot:ORY36923.1 hypothetical protein BCR33DRAFT_721838 [Rhizoclosmatium globosum]